MKLSAPKIGLTAAGATLLVNVGAPVGASEEPQEEASVLAPSVTLYRDAGLIPGSARLTLSGNDPNLDGNVFTPGGEDADDETSSARNNSSTHWAVLWEDSGYGDKRFCMKPGREWADFRDMPGDRRDFGDMVSAVSFHTTLPDGIDCDWK